MSYSEFYIQEGDKQALFKDTDAMIMHLAENGQLSGNIYLADVPSVKIAYNLDSGEVRLDSNDTGGSVKFFYSEDVFQGLLHEISNAIKLVAKIQLLQQLADVPTFASIIQEFKDTRTHESIDSALRKVTKSLQPKTDRSWLSLFHAANNPKEQANFQDFMDIKVRMESIKSNADISDILNKLSVMVATESKPTLKK